MKNFKNKPAAVLRVCFVLLSVSPHSLWADDRDLTAGGAGQDVSARCQAGGAEASACGFEPSDFNPNTAVLLVWGESFFSNGDYSNALAMAMKLVARDPNNKRGQALLQKSAGMLAQRETDEVQIERHAILGAAAARIEELRRRKDLFSETPENPVPSPVAAAAAPRSKGPEYRDAVAPAPTRREGARDDGKMTPASKAAASTGREDPAAAHLVRGNARDFNLGGIVNFGFDNLNDARRHFQTALTLDPNNIEARRQLEQVEHQLAQERKPRWE